MAATYDIKVGDIEGVTNNADFHEKVMAKAKNVSNINVAGGDGGDKDNALKTTFAENATKAQEAYKGATAKKKTLDDAIAHAKDDGNSDSVEDKLKKLLDAIKTFNGEETVGGRSKKSSKRGGSKRRGSKRRGSKSKSKGRKH